MPPVFDLDKCTGCGICEECMADVIYMKEVDGKSVPFLEYPDECWHCGACRQDCPVSAITITFPPEMLIM